MKNREIIFVIVAVLVMSCLTIAGTGGPAEPQEMYSQYQTLSRIVATVTANYVKEVDREKLFYGAYKGMLQTLDPHSAFLPPEQKKGLEAETKGEFGGLGIEITLDKVGVLTVITPLEDTPAFRAGVLAGDPIIKIEGESTKGVSLREAVNKLRGPKGKPVTITVLHENGKVEDITIVRDIIKVESVKDVHFIDDKHKIAYIRLSQFQANTAGSLDNAVAQLLEQGMGALVLDLRFNPGGLLASAVQIADRFLPEGVIVSTKGRQSPQQVYEATKDATYPNFPLAVLISGRSASASEIVAGAIQDHKRGVLVGKRTFGKGSVQTIIKLEDGKSALRLTTAYYYTPSGRLIQRHPNDPHEETWGIDPEIEVKTTLQDEMALWDQWRQKHLREAREHTAGQEQGTEEQAAPKTEPQPTQKQTRPPGGAEAGPEKEAEEFHDKTLEAAVNALKGMMLVRERAAKVAGKTTE